MHLSTLYKSGSLQLHKNNNYQNLRKKSSLKRFFTTHSKHKKFILSRNESIKLLPLRDEIFLFFLAKLFKCFFSQKRKGKKSNLKEIISTLTFLRLNSVNKTRSVQKRSLALDKNFLLLCILLEDDYPMIIIIWLCKFDPF